jgi:carbon monoxide dehydrogenase subunit G
MGRIRESVVVNGLPAEVFDFITDQGHVADWNDHVQRVEVVGGGPVGVGSRLRQHRLRNNRDFVLEFDVRTHEPPRRHVVEGSVFGVATTMAFVIEPAAEGSRVTMEADVKGRGLSVLLAPIVTREMRKSTVAALRQLRQLRAADAADR